MESINKLRQAADELAQRAMPCSNAPDYADVRWKVHQLADEIEREVEEMQRALTIDMQPMTDENMAESGWMRLPLDADGIPIHVGDVLTDGEYKFVVCELAAFGDGSWSIRNEDGNAWAACDVTHHRTPTVEDVLREFAAEVETAGGVMELPDEALAEYAAKLRLAEEVE